MTTSVELSVAALSLDPGQSDAEAHTPPIAFEVKPFTIDLSTRATRMISLVKAAQLPDKPAFPGLGSTFGADLDKMKELQSAWTTTFNWSTQQEAMNKYPHFTAIIEGLTIHYIYQKSKNHGAIPLILIHGWPASFLQFLPLVEPLTTMGKTSTGASVSFDIVIPSLPGFAFSSPPPVKWTLQDTARIFDILMTKVLGYKTHAVFGTDFGCVVGYSMYSKFPTNVRSASFDYIPFIALMPDQLTAEGIVLDDYGKFAIQILVKTATTGIGYYYEQSTEPNTIGLALFDNPLGQLIWMGSKYLLWSDPRAGTNGSLVNTDNILASISLYFLTESFISATFTYAQNATSFGTVYTRAPTDAPMLFSSFKFNNQYWPKEIISRVGNMVFYKEHDFGGHFPSLDNPTEFVDDLREIRTFFK
ncbi:Alpha/Beta hydrolase protein [Collybia nuda]|uniref:Alpha/Beta hydrolase protein n=1 Tax=Collybia nuda TaxID=64659 RepID=A0A9P5YFZ0_9AGAR|nr:Alpha/Beta hydrolase protein [Collybia nuda]